MSKTALIIGREYFTRVKKKSFLLTTILVPIVIIGFYAAIIAITIKGGTEKKNFGVIDEGQLFSAAIPEKEQLKLTIVKGETESSFVKKYKDQGYDGFLYIPQFNLDTPGRFVVHSQSSLNMSTNSLLEDALGEAIEKKRMEKRGIDPAAYAAISADVEIENTIDTKEGGKKSVAAVAYGVSFACGILIYMMMIIYGTQVMRGVMEEKTNRIAEVVVSSVKPFQLMMGKILGIGMVGLTQFAIWIIIMVLLQFAMPLIFPDMLKEITAATAANENTGLANSVLVGVSSLPLLKIVFLFLFYFLAGYLTYASLFAAIGSVVSDDQQEAQQLVFPVLMPIILGFVIMTNAINDPNTPMAVFGSLFPLTSPIVMMGRVTYDIPVWQLLLSMALLVGCFFLFTWITGRIYRVGILMYGKKPSWKQMMKWGFSSK